MSADPRTNKGIWYRLDHRVHIRSADSRKNAKMMPSPYQSAARGMPLRYFQITTTIDKDNKMRCRGFPATYSSEEKIFIWKGSPSQICCGSSGLTPTFRIASRNNFPIRKFNLSL